MKNRDINRLLTDHYDRLIYPPQPLKSEKTRSKIMALFARKQLTVPAHKAEIKP
ncbi:MAG: hypothetical protein KF824_06355 [Fimbriimonadaceae bacterium]|nr:MAG: hypothetical protein KF824_06355 [Fimbriimonadaceae bacterium]